MTLGTCLEQLGPLRTADNTAAPERAQNLLEVKRENTFVIGKTERPPFALGRKCFALGESRGSTAIHLLFLLLASPSKRLLRQERTDGATCKSKHSIKGPVA